MAWHPVFLWIRLIEISTLILLVRVILSWFPEARHSKFYWYLFKVTEPVLAPVRSAIPNLGIDISPIIVIFLLNLITRIISKVFSY